MFAAIMNDAPEFVFGKEGNQNFNWPAGLGGKLQVQYSKIVS